MRKPFAELFEIMEDRRRQRGEVRPGLRTKHSRRAGRRVRGCPDTETLCGWVDGHLRRKNLGRWLAVWQHVHIWRCRTCQAEIATLADALCSTGEARLLEPFWLVGVPGLTMKRLMASWPLKAPLAWASWGVVIVAAVSLWSLGTHKPLETVGERSEPALTEEMRSASQAHSAESIGGIDTPAENMTIWGD
jgi:hypothetical protein